jgi:homocitrate synthase NifV
VGANLFLYENENRASSVLRDAANYEVFPPEAVGLQRSFLLGKHSGVDTLKLKLREHGVEISDQEAAAFICRIRTRSVKLKRALFDEELLDFYREEIGDVREETRASLAEGREPLAEAAASLGPDLEAAQKALAVEETGHGA